MADKNDNTLKIWSSIGALAGAYYSYSKKKTFTGYILPMVIGGIAGSIVANIINKRRGAVSKPIVENKAIVDNKAVVESKPPVVASSDKTTKIKDLVKSLRNEPNDTSLDKFHTEYFSKLTDKEIDLWMVLSKALKDPNFQKEAEKSKESAYKYLSSKYKLNSTDVDSAMNKYGEALAKKMV